MPTKIFICVTPEEKILGNSFLKKNLNGRKLIITNDILIATKSSSILLIVALGITTKKKLIEVCNKLAQQNNQLLGVLVLN